MGKEITQVAICPYCMGKNKVKWPKGDTFRAQRIATK